MEKIKLFIMHILIINGHKYYPFAKGRLNKTLFDEQIQFLKNNNNVETTVIETGYQTDQEIEKFKRADTIIFQTPINWFSVPWTLKQYIDEVYRYRIFYEGSEDYGRGGLLKDKQYMFSLTWNSPKEAFLPGEFFDGRSVDDAIIALHKTNEFCGMKKLETFSVHNVIKNPDVKNFKEELRQHLQRLF